jgi:hypothetical protein
VMLVITCRPRFAWAFFTVDCGIVTIERSDPLVSPGAVSAHTHVVAGSDTFGPSATNAILRQGAISVRGPRTRSACRQSDSSLTGQIEFDWRRVTPMHPWQKLSWQE